MRVWTRADKAASVGNDVAGSASAETRRNSPFANFLKNERGTISVESVIWVPLFLVFFSMIADVANMMYSRSVATRIVEDANRLAITGWLRTDEQVKTHVTTAMKRIADAPNVQVAWNDQDLITVVTYAGNDVQPIGFLSIFTDMQLSVRAYDRFEI